MESSAGPMAGADLARAAILLVLVGWWVAGGGPPAAGLTAAIVVLAAGDAVFRPRDDRGVARPCCRASASPAANALFDHDGPIGTPAPAPGWSACWRAAFPSFTSSPSTRPRSGCRPPWSSRSPRPWSGPLPRRAGRSCWAASSAASRPCAATACCTLRAVGLGGGERVVGRGPLPVASPSRSSEPASPAQAAPDWGPTAW